MQQIDMKMQDVEFVRLLADGIKHHDVIRRMVPDGRVETKRHLGAANELGLPAGISAGK